MSSYQLVIAPLAKNDLEQIYAYGVHHWGNKRADNYLDSLKELFWQLTQLPKMGVERDELRPKMRSFAVDTHIIFYLLQKKQVEIVRVLHGRQDSLKHFK